MDKPRTLMELPIEERRAIYGDGKVRPNMKRIRECLLGIHCANDLMRRQEFINELGMTHSTYMHDWIIHLEEMDRAPGSRKFCPGCGCPWGEPCKGECQE